MKDWKKISEVLKTRSCHDVKLYADQLERRFPKLRKFFSLKKVHKMQVTRGGIVQGYRGAAPAAAGAASQSMPPHSNPTLLAAMATDQMKREASRSSKPRVVIYLSHHVVDTGAAPSLVRRVTHQQRPANTLFGEYGECAICRARRDIVPRHAKTLNSDFLPLPPGQQDLSARPAVPTNGQQVFLPGIKVYARWLDKDDPASYGTVSDAKDGHFSISAVSVLYFATSSQHFIANASLPTVVSWSHFCFQDCSNPRRMQLHGGA